MEQKKAKKGMAMAVVLIVLFVVTIIGFALASRGTQTLSTAFQSKENMLALYAAQAGIANEMYDIEEYKLNPAIPPAGGYTYDSSNNPLLLPQSLPNNALVTNQMVWANYNKLCSGPITASDGTTVPCGTAYLASTGTMENSTKLERTMIIIGDDYTLLSQNTIQTTGSINGPIRNNQSTGSPSISIGGTGTSAITSDSTGSISGTFSTTEYNAPQLPIPNIPVSQIAQNCGSTAGGCSSCTNITGETGGTLTGPACYYSTSNFTMDGNSGGGFTMTGGAKLYILGNLRINGGPHLNLSGGEGDPASSTTPANNNLIVISGTVTANGNTSSYDWNASLIVGGTPGGQNLTFHGPTPTNFIGFFYSQQGNMTIPGNLVGQAIAKGSTSSSDGQLTVDGNVTENQNYFTNYTNYFNSLPIASSSQWSK